MSYEQLMEHANNIRAKAVWRAVQKHEVEPIYAATSGPEGYYANIPELFRPFSELPDPNGYSPLIADYRVILSKLSSGNQDQDPIDGHQTYLANPQLDKMQAANSNLLDWTGHAAVAFRSRFLTPFPSLVKNQFIIASVLKAALEAHQAMWASARRDIDALAETTIKALDSDPCCDPTKWSVEFTIAASIAAVAAVPLAAVTEGMSVPLTLTAVGAAAQVVAAKPPDSIKENKSGSTALQIVEEMKKDIKTIEQQITKAEERITMSLAANVSDIGRHPDLFVAARPALANATAANVRSGGFLGEAL
ncbi:hypothetical protein [Rhizomonospora bruguierae]|uniref:hypothetical protein n=1 Tax=Rhizomonospora bruguierae TaxID=1581705 RepID=UPI001BD09FCB|nr:hypothetical protein [Micromonospora sp. NBRC 107566]